MHPFHSPRDLKEVIIPAIERGLEKHGRQRHDFRISVMAFVATSPEEQAFARSQVAFYASTPSYRPVMALHGWSDAAERLSAHAARGEWSEMPALVTDEMLREFCLITDEEHLARELKKRYEGIADRLGLYLPFRGREKEVAQALSHDFGLQRVDE